MLEDLLCKVGVPVYIVSKYGIKSKSLLKIDKKAGESNLQWRLQPLLSCEFSYINLITNPEESESGFHISFLLHDFKLTLEMEDQTSADIAGEIYTCLTSYLQKARSIQRAEKDQNVQKGTSQYNPAYQQSLTLRKAISDAATKEEQLIQLCFYLRYKEAYMIVEKVRGNYLVEWKRSAFSHWVRVVKDNNDDKMVKDRNRWRLHATANQEIDLQAWYHGLFYLEVCVFIACYTMCPFIASSTVF